MDRSPRARLSSRRLCRAVESLECRRLLAANLVISEFLASNDNSIVDDFGNREDWIEIHNAGDAPANLGDYSLTDNAAQPTQWRFPDQSLAAGAYLVVFASDRNLAVAGSPLHTNFKLGAGGEYLGLIRADDGLPQFEYAPAFPAQSTDISYGLLDADDPASARVFFATPTPGAANTPSVQQPTFSVPGGTFSGSIAVSLSTPTPGAQIRYTTDRSTPTLFSPLYTGTPITLTTTTQLRVIAFATGHAPSPVTSRTYIAVDSSVSSFSSNLPIVVLDTHGASLNDTTYRQASASFIDTTAGGDADMLGASDYSGRVGIRIRGSTSANYPKKQYRFETWDEADEDRKVPLLGLPTESDWILYAPYTERSLQQNTLAMQWANATGHYASRTRYVEVYLNTDGGSSINYASDYLGVYILMENVKTGDDRVDIVEMKSTDNTGEAVTGGYIFKKDRADPDETTFTTTLRSQRFVMVEPDETGITTQQLAYLSGYMNSFEAALFGPNFADPAVGYAAYIDVDSFVDYWLVNEMTRNIDAFWLSTYYTKDRNGKVAIGPVWDFNLSLGAANYNQSANAAGWNSDTLSPEKSPYYTRLFQDPNFRVRVADRWQELRSGVFSTTQLMADIDANVQLLSAGNGNYPVGTVPPQTPNNPAVRNFQRWPVLGIYTTTSGFFDPQGRWIEDVNLMKNWLTARVDWMDAQFVPPPALSPAGGAFVGAIDLTMTPRAQASAVDTVLMSENAPARAFIPTSAGAAIPNWASPTYTPTASWLTGTGGVGYDRITGGSAVNYLPYVGLNVGAMYNVTPSVYTRFTFTLTQAQLDDLQHLVLAMRYDDGFTAWVNGVRAIDANTPENVNPVWNTAAPTDRGDAATLVVQEFDISSVIGQLVVGTNVLAIQGMNRTASSSDLLVQPKLISRRYTTANATGTVYYTTDGSDPRTPGNGISPAAVAYAGPLNLSASTRLRARALVGGGAWSALADAIYTFDADALRISELMYNPPGSQDYEFVEVTNIAAAPLDLDGYTFSSGIDFTFPAGTTLQPGAFGVIVKNLSAFTERYGDSLNILGVYTGSLDNGGERIAIDNAVGQTVLDFTYDDTGPGWYPETDGGGYSLVIRDVHSDKSTWSSPAAWRASYAPLGLPGMSDVDATAPNVVGAAYARATHTIALTFSEHIAAAPAGLALVDLLTGASITPGAVAVDGAVATIALPPLAGGLYRLTFPAGATTDVAGNPLANPFAWSLLYVPDGETLVLPPDAPPHAVDQLALGTSSTLDIGRASLVIRNADAGVWTAAGYTGLAGHVVAARAGGAGITSGLLDADHTVAVAAATGRFGLNAGESASWQGLDVYAGDALLRYTLAGDADLDGDVDFDDLLILAQAYGSAGRTYLEGNLDHSADGSVNFDDLLLLAQRYGTSPLVAPEPSKPTAAGKRTRSTLDF